MNVLLGRGKGKREQSSLVLTNIWHTHLPTLTEGRKVGEFADTAVSTQGGYGGYFIISESMSGRTAAQSIRQEVQKVLQGKVYVSFYVV